MKVEIRILRDDGTEIDYKEGTAFQPLDMRTHPERPLVEGQRALFGWLWQPVTTLDLSRPKQS